MPQPQPTPLDPRISILGLHDGEKTMQQSIHEYAQTFFSKWSAKNEADALVVHVKSSTEGVKRRYACKARAVIGQKVITAQTPDDAGATPHFDAYSAIKEALRELSRRLADDVHSKPRSSGRRAAGSAEGE